jgi:peptide-methionine (S)-S-oxide reductase
VGYTGGTTPSPTYRQMGDHTETLQLEYDPARISYQELLARFWNAHNPMSPGYSQQYKAAIFFHDERQRALALQSRDALLPPGSPLYGRVSLFTEILPAQTFYLAEGYHQKYRLQHNKVLLGELQRFYPEIEALTNSTAAARINGFLAGYGECPSSPEGLAYLGIQSPAAIRELLQAAGRKRR